MTLPGQSEGLLEHFLTGCVRSSLPLKFLAVGPKLLESELLAGWGEST